RYGPDPIVGSVETRFPTRPEPPRLAHVALLGGEEDNRSFAARRHREGERRRGGSLGISDGCNGGLVILEIDPSPSGKGSSAQSTSARGKCAPAPGPPSSARCPPYACRSSDARRRAASRCAAAPGRFRGARTRISVSGDRTILEQQTRPRST